MQSIKPGKQRKNMFKAPLHKKRKWISAHLEENLLLKYDKRALPVIKGDNVRVMRGSFKGHEDKIVKVNVKKQSLEIEGITMSKADGNKIAKPIHPSNVLITKLNLTDKWRRKKIERGLSEEVKKEIEEEAEEQIKEIEEEKKKQEAERKALEEIEEKEVAEEIEEEKGEIEVSKEKKKTEDEPVKKPAQVKTVKKPQEKIDEKKQEKPKTKKAAPKKQTAKKTTTKTKTSTKKTSKKPSEKKEVNK